MPPSEPSSWSTTASSVAPSAAAQMRTDMLANQRLLLLAQKNAADFKRRLAEATAKLEKQQAPKQSKVTKKSKRRTGVKRKSPPAAEPKEAALAEPSESPTPPKKSKRAGPFKDVMAAATAQNTSDWSDDEAPAPDSEDQQSVGGADDQKAYKGLNSILCAYKDPEDKEVNPRDASTEITFEMCAELCQEEIADTLQWSTSEIAARHHMIISALKLVYKDKNPTWFEQGFLQSGKGAQKYWVKVLKRREVLWRAAHDKQKLLRAQSKAKTGATKTLKQKLREKIKQKKMERTGTQPKPSRTAKPAVVVISDSSNSSDEEAEASAAKAEPESAPAPDAYTPVEIKTFANMAKAIRNADDSNGLSSAVADFIDSEFSDNM